jgi:hypothetical protein
MMRNTLLRSSLAAAATSLLLALAGCSSDSPSEPQRNPPPPPGTNPQPAAFNIAVTATPPTLEVETDQVSEILVRVRRADNGAPPPNGTSILIETTLGVFSTGVTQVAGSLFGGDIRLQLLPGTTPGTAIIRAQLQGSIGQAAVRILEQGDFFISFVEPPLGSPQGGDTVEIRGGGFRQPARVLFGTTAAQVLSVNQGRIRAITPPSTVPVPPNQTLPVPVTVTINVNSDDERTDTLPNGFTYTPGGVDPQQPVILSVNPPSGPNAGGTRVTLTGAGFQSPVQVLFGQGTAASFSGVEATVESVAADRVVVISPPALGLGQDNRNQQVSILVRNVGNGFAGVAVDAFRYGETVQISGLSPLEGPAAGGTDVTVFGTGFVEPLQVTIAGVEQQVLSVAPDRVVFRTVGVRVTACPASGVVQMAPVQVRLLGSGGAGGDVVVNSDQNFRYIVAVPQILGINPTTGTQNGGTLVTLTGSGFESPAQVTFTNAGESFVGVVQSVTSTTITVRTPQVTDSAMDESPCDVNNDGTVGMRFVPTGFDVQVENLVTGCDSNVLSNAFIFQPANNQCRGDVGPVLPACSDGIDNDMDGFIDFPADPECTGPADNDESM